MKACELCGGLYRKPRRDDHAVARFCSRSCAAKDREAHKPKSYITADRFWSKVQIRQPDECWEWQGAKSSHGYGQIQGPGHVPVHAHKVAYALTNGPVCEGMYVCHHCDNPPCVNPTHLYQGTPQDNVRDMDQRGRRRLGNPARGERHGRSKLNVTAVRAIRASSASFTELAAMHGVSTDAIRAVRQRRVWAWLEDVA